MDGVGDKVGGRRKEKCVCVCAHVHVCKCVCVHVSVYVSVQQGDGKMVWSRENTEDHFLRITVGTY